MSAQLKSIAAPEREPGRIVDGGYLISDATLREIGEGNIQQGRRTIRLMLADERQRKDDPGPTPKPANVRLGLPKDEAATVDLIGADCRRQAPGWAPISPERILECVQNGTQGKMGVVGVIDGPGVIAGAVVLFPVQAAFSKVYYVQEIFHVVHPDYRRTSYAEDLLNFAKYTSDEWSRQFGYPVHLLYQVNGDHRTREKIRFFRRRMQQVGGIFLYPPIER